LTSNQYKPFNSGYNDPASLSGISPGEPVTSVLRNKHCVIPAAPVNNRAQAAMPLS
jgi:hypothetical protein